MKTGRGGRGGGRVGGRGRGGGGQVVGVPQINGRHVDDIQVTTSEEQRAEGEGEVEYKREKKK